MCGIAFILSDKNYDKCETAIKKMTTSLRHRGPDACNYISANSLNEKLFFGHTRLSILDLSEAASQPMYDHKTGSYLIYNGEIYNYLELKKDLQKNAINIFSTGDTEILFKLLILYGEDVLPKLRGMFSFVFWDGKKNELIVARDEFGIKPLYYSNYNGIFLIASEIKSILASSLIKFSTNNNSIVSFLTYGFVVRPQTIVKEIKEVQPGSYFKIKNANEKVKEIKYTFFSPNKNLKIIKEPLLAAEIINAALENSVDRHLYSDVPVGVFLSGGIDSSLLSIIAAERRDDISLFTVSFSGTKYNELKYAFEVAQKIYGNHNIINLSSDDILNYFNLFKTSLDQPTVDGFNTYIISNIAKFNNIKVLVSGLGGDEFFGGYTSFRNNNLLNRFRYTVSAFSVLKKNLFNSNYLFYDKAAYSYKNQTPFQDYLLQRSIRWGKHCLPLEKSLVPPESYELVNQFETEFDYNSLDSSYRSVSRFESNFYMSQQLLRDSDIFSMANSIELRLPFLDKDLVDTAYSISQDLHYDIFNSKKILKSILHKKIPYLDIKRKKMGFTFPWDIWLNNQLKEVLVSTFDKKDLFKSLGLDYNKARILLDNYFERKTSVSWFQVWSLFILLIWQEKYKLNELS